MILSNLQYFRRLLKATGEMRSQRSGEIQIAFYVTATATMLDQEVGRVEARIPSRA